jgi:TonB family protein
MPFPGIKNKRLCLLLLLVLYGAPVGASGQQTGTVAGGTLFVDESEKTTLGDAANVTVELEHEGRTLTIVSDDNGDFIVKLSEGIYRLKSARDAGGKVLHFSASQHEQFRVEPDKDTRFDVMLLQPDVAKLKRETSGSLRTTDVRFVDANRGERPLPLKVVRPAYPPIAAARRISGLVRVDVEVDPDGKVINARGASGHTILQAAALKAATGWRFNSASENAATRSAQLTFIFHKTSQVPKKNERDFKPPYQM